MLLMDRIQLFGRERGIDCMHKKEFYIGAWVTEPSFVSALFDKELS